MNGFDTIVMVDWSARSRPSPPKPARDAVYIAVNRRQGAEIRYCRTRHEACALLETVFDAAIGYGGRVLAGFDFPFGYPRGFAEAITGRADPFAIWAWLADRIEDAPDNRNNRFAVADAANRMLPGLGPFWGCPRAWATEALPERGSLRHGHGMEERRRIEVLVRSAQPCWKLFTTGSVGSQSLLGLPRLQAFRLRYGPALSVSPFEAPDTPIVLAEIYPSMLAGAVKALARPGEIRDAAQVRVMAEAFAAVDPGTLDAMLREGDLEEGWILGFGHECTLLDAVGAAQG